LAPSAVIVAACLLTGCAVHYYDQNTRTEHLWGFGHLKMRAVPQKDDGVPPTNAVMAFVTGTRTLGLRVGGGEDFAGLSAGWDARSRLTIKTEDSSFYLLWPNNSIWLPRGLKDLFTCRVGPDFPFPNSASNPNPEPKETSP